MKLRLVLDMVLHITQKWVEENKLSASDERLLLEAYRRFHMFHKGRTTIRKAWLGLGFPSEYGKSRYFRSLHTTTPPRCLSWYLLTEKGARVLSSLLYTLPWKNEYNRMIFSQGI